MAKRRLLGKFFRDKDEIISSYYCFGYYNDEVDVSKWIRPASIRADRVLRKEAFVGQGLSEAGYKILPSTPKMMQRVIKNIFGTKFEDMEWMTSRLA